MTPDLYPDLDTPQALIDLDVVDRNVAAMRALGRERGVAVRVHFKSLKCGGLAGYLMAAFTQRKQALHDLICGTLVVDKWAYTHHPERQRRELGTITWVILVLGGLLALLGLLAMGALIAALGGGFGR